MVVESEKSRRLSRQPEMTSYRKRSAVKLEVEDYSEEEQGSFSKRSRGFPSFPQQWDMKANAFPIPPSQYNPLDEPSPLGLQLRKSPSLLDLIQMRLSQGGDDSTVAGNEYFKSDIKKESSRSSVASTSIDKLKASNFPAKLLKIGSWEYKSRYEGDLVAKCYFAKHKLVWEVLEGGLKSKIEIQWSDIMAIKANCPDDGIGTLNIVLARQPLFFRETNPQPRKHTLWQATSDFTDGQASLHRQHFLECSQGMLNKHFEKLIQCDMRLNFLSRQPEMVLDSPYFESRPSIFEDPGEIKTRIQVVSSKRSTFLGFHGLASPTGAAQSPSFETEKGDLGSVASEHVSREAPSPSSVMDTHAMEGNGMGKEVDSRRARNWDEIKLPGLHPSMSMSDLMNHIGHRLSEQTTFGNTLFSENGSEYHEILEDIAQYLLSDTQFTTTSDEKSVMSRVNSLCCLLQKDPSTITNGESCFDQDTNAKDVQLIHKLEATYNNNNKNGDNNNETKPSEVNDDDDTRDVSTSKQPTGLSRKDSYGELLLHLPRITSLPKFLFNIYEEDDNHGR